MCECSELRAGATPGALLLARPTPDGSRVSLWESERVCAAIGHAELPGWTRRAPKQLSSDPGSITTVQKFTDS